MDARLLRLSLPLLSAFSAVKIDCENLTLERPGGIRAVRGLSLCIDAAQTPAVALLGGNGAGKSTLLEGILGLVPIRSGRILVDSVPVERGNLSAIRRRIGLIFQHSDNQLVAQTVREDVAFGPRNLRLPEAEIAARTDEALAQLSITHLADRDTTRLSGGEKRRVALAGILAMRPEAILLDEPDAMLDPRACRELGDCLNALPVLKIVATHNLAFARRVCPHAILLKDGQLFHSGPTSDLLNAPSLLESCNLL